MYNGESGARHRNRYRGRYHAYVRRGEARWKVTRTPREREGNRWHSEGEESETTQEQKHVQHLFHREGSFQIPKIRAIPERNLGVNRIASRRIARKHHIADARRDISRTLRSLSHPCAHD